MPEPAKPLRIFLSYAHADVLSVRKLHRYLREKGFDVWFDKESLVPGQDWQLEIERGLSHSDVVIICLSQAAVSAEGFVQREFRFALDRALEMPEGRIFLIPVRLQPCEAPSRLSRYHWVDLFEREGYLRLMRGLKHCAEQLERAHVDESQPVNIPDPDSDFSGSVSVGKDVGGNVIIGNNNVIHMMPAAPAQAEAEKAEKQKEENENREREKAKAEKIAQEKIEQERMALEKAEAERIAEEEAESKKIAQEKLEQERADGKKAEAQRIADAEAERERLAILKVENERKAREKAGQQLSSQQPKTTAKGWIFILVLSGALIWSLLGFPFPRLSTSVRTPTQPVSVIAVTKTPTSAHTPAAGDMMISEKDGMKLHYVPAGEFMMGDTAEAALAECEINTYCQLDWFKAEAPPHKVNLDAFWIDETEVTNQIYALCVKAGKCQPPSDKSSVTHTSYYDDAQYADYPVIYVSWSDAKAYCEWAGRALPSEAQWEKAARSPSGNTHPWGNGAPNKDLANYNQNVGDTTKVGQYPNGKSFYGVYDMAGKVWEWVNDWFSDTYYASSPSTNPAGPAAEQYRVIRGGSWNSNPFNMRASYRFWAFPDDRGNSAGFRCALSQ